MDNLEEIRQLFEKLHSITHLRNIAFHRINNGYLNPVHIMSTEIISSSQWKSEHNKLHITIKGDAVLERVVKGQVVYINDVENEKNSPAVFSNFGIKSIAVFPLFNKELDTVIGLIVIPALEKKFNFDDNIIEQCNLLIKQFNENMYK